MKNRCVFLLKLLFPFVLHNEKLFFIQNSALNALMSDLWTKKTFLFLMNLDFYQSTFDCIRVNLILKRIIKLPLSASGAAPKSTVAVQNHSTACGKFAQPVDTFLLEDAKTEKRRGRRFDPHQSRCRSSMSRAVSIRRGKTHRLLAPRLRSLGVGGLTSGDDADVSLVHARVFILFPRVSQEG